ncbi:hypothetical protein J27TS8_40930 [Robertmurraya siralis]|uniref:SLH domain-containing protein n=1 Tax=Robertmurraya siralis TaxID=77777 RepID=A0A920BV88_9BACI|nr:5'-nucleotidase C-terminal domain-containing protein [Robertmurraya siralis]GIN64100.1 hypothetical protein J27TS8_40930 [Robertmurraya siralis]
MTNRALKRFLATAATTVMVASAIVPAASAATASFKDVSANYKDAVDFLVSKGANGLNATTFGIANDIKRVDAAVLLANVLGLDTKNVKDSGFTDVPLRAKGAVNALKAAGITSGKSSKLFGSDDKITRGEIAIWVQKGFNLTGESKHPFKDVNSRYEEAVRALFSHSITKGINASNFGVTNQVKRGDYAIFLYKAAQLDNGAFKLSIMHTNDTHAHLEMAAKRSTAIKEVRATKPDALLLDAGDVFSGTLFFNKFEGQADLEVMNYMKYDAMTFGNHEFDLGSSSEGHKALSEFVKNADFPFVSANVDFSKDSLFSTTYKGGTIADIDADVDGKIFDGVIKEVNGEKVGIFGLTTEETVTISSPGAVEFTNYIEEARKMVDAFEEKGINKIIAVTHLGFDDNVEFDNDLELATKVDGIDVIVGGHTHTTLTAPVLIKAGKEPTVIVQANEYSKYLGLLDVSFDENGVVSHYKGELIDLASKADDPAVLQILKPYSDEIEALQKESIGVNAVVDLDGERANVRTKETNLGNLITDGMLATAKTINNETVAAFTNGGGIRASIPAGDITLGDVLTTMPFGNTLGIMNLTGAEIKEALEHSVKMAPEQNGAFLQVSGLKFTYDSRKPVGQKVMTIEISDGNGNYVPINESSSYFVATNTFTAKGGDDFDVFKRVYEDGRVSEPGYVDYDMFVDYLKALPEVRPAVEGRITDVSASN